MEISVTGTNIDEIMSIDAFLHETKESGRKKRRSSPRNEILIVKVCHFSGYETCHID